MAIDSGKMSISYFTENKGVLLTLTVKKNVLITLTTDWLYWIDVLLFKKC